MPKLAYRPDIDGLRAVAVASVILYHLDLKAFQGGFVGVDVFFVISGYLITRIVRSDIARGTFSLKQFYIKRFRRIFPAAGVTLAATLILASFVLSPPYMRQFGASLLASIFSVSNLFFWSESGYFDAESQLKPLLHTWSLSVEEQFYLFWPLFLALLARNGPKWRVPLGIAAIGALSFGFNFPFGAGAYGPALAQLVSAGKHFNDGPASIFFLTPFRIFEFCIGALCIWAEAFELRKDWISELLCVLGFSAVLGSVHFYRETLIFPQRYALIPCLGAALLILGGRSRFLGRLLDNKVMVTTGVMSYSLYLVHWPIIALYKYFKADRLDNLEKLVLVGLAVALARLLHTQIERRFRHPKDGPAVENTNFFRWSLGSTALLSLLALSAWQQNGWGFRSGKAEFLVAGVEKSQDFKTEHYGGKGCKPPRCEANEKAPGEVVYVIGDSYSRAYYEGLKTIFPNQHFVFFEEGGCEFYTHSYVGSNTKHAKRCKSAKQRAYKEIAKSRSTVILTQHWETNSEETQHSDDPGKSEVKYEDPPRYAAFVDQEFRELRALLGPRKWIFIGGPPKFGQNGSPLDCLTRPFVQRDCCFTPIKRVKWHRQFNEVVGRALGPETTFIDPYPLLCDGQRCRNMTDDDKSIYSDYGHLSLWGSRYLVQRMKDQLAAGL